MPALFLSEYRLISVLLKTNSESTVVFSVLSQQFTPGSVATAGPALSLVKPFPTVAEQGVVESNLITELLDVRKDIKKDVDKYCFAAITQEQGIGQSTADILKLPEKHALKGAATYSDSQDSDSKFMDAVQEELILATDKSILSYECCESIECQRPVQEEEKIPFTPPPIMQNLAYINSGKVNSKMDVVINASLLNSV